MHNNFLLLIAGVSAGLGGSIAGIASIFSFPALLAIGLDPIDANITNAVSLFFLSVGSILGSKQELVGFSQIIKKIAPANLIGGIIGAGLLLVTPSHSFRHIAPFLMIIASLAILIPTANQKSSIIPKNMFPIQLLAAGIGIYCGYFGAASGSLTLALLIQSLGVGIPVASAMKNVLLGISNGIAAFIFMFTGRVHWLLVIPLAIGFFIGGRTGPIIVRHSNQKMLKRGISLFGIVTSIYLLVTN